MHLLARLDRERRHILRQALRHQRGNPLADLFAVLVELRLPQEAGKHGTAQLREDADVTSARTLVSHEREALEVDTHGSLLEGFTSYGGKNVPGTIEPVFTALRLCRIRTYFCLK